MNLSENNTDWSVTGTLPQLLSSGGRVVKTKRELLFHLRRGNSSGTIQLLPKQSGLIEKENRLRLFKSNLEITL